jgi:tryptophan halogenase
MAAAALARFGGRSVAITLVESDDIGTVGVGEATIPQIRLFNAALGIDENEFLRETQGTIKLGIEFVDWLRPGHRYMHAFGTVGRALGIVPFHHFWLRGRAEGAAKDFGAYSLNEAAARAGRFGRVARQPGSVLPEMPYAFHFDAALYARYLRRYAEGRGVRRVEGRVVSVERDGESGDIASVTLESGASHGAELFVDCSGFRGLLIEQTLGAGFEDWSEWLPCDRAMAVPSARAPGLEPYTRSTAKAAGWQWRIPLQHRTGNGYVYSSAHISDDEAAAALLAGLDTEALDDPRPLRFKAGRRRRMWVGNCIALGLAAGFMEPLESTSIHLVQSAIERLLALLPAGGDMRREAAEFNRRADFEWERIRDFIILHYRASERDDSDLWRRCRTMRLPHELQRRIDLFRGGGRIVRDHDELFTELAWMQVMIGQNILPTAWHPLANGPREADLAGFLADLARIVEHETAAMPAHKDFIARHAAAAAA